MRPRVANLHPFKKASKCQLATPPPDSTELSDRRGELQRGSDEGQGGSECGRGASGAVGAGVKSETTVYAAKFAAKGGRSGPGRRR